MNERSAITAIVIQEERVGQRLDNYLLSQLKDLPRSLVYKLIRSGQVRVNGRRVKADYRLEDQDCVRVPPVQQSRQPSKKMPSRTLLDALGQATIYEDSRLLVLNKPSGVASHGGSGIQFGVIEALRLLHHNPGLELVHRLDRDTSGILVIAKKRSALRELQVLMRPETKQRLLRKQYRTLLVGRFPEGQMIVDAPLHVSLRQGGERYVRVDPQGKASKTQFVMIARGNGLSYCQVWLYSGRTHQIRAHAQYIGFPIAGDLKYGDDAVNSRLNRQLGLKRLFLHAYSLEFALDQGRVPYQLTAPLTTDLNDVLAQLDCA